MKNNENTVITNTNIKLLSVLKSQLMGCNYFVFVVAFITKSGISLLKQELINLEKSNIRGLVITGDYLNFTEPNAIRELIGFSNLDVYVSRNIKLHSKGYYFEKQDCVTLIVGSSNLTQNAMTINEELNVMIKTQKDSSVALEFLAIQNRIDNNLFLAKDVIDQYESDYINAQLKVQDPILQIQSLLPNKMQQDALNNLELLRLNGKEKALIISATGTGKTFLAAFDVKQYNSKKMLFIVHRHSILSQALASFKQVMPNKKMGLYLEMGNIDYDYVFITIQTLSRSSHLSKFQPSEFDYIIIDEAHHVASSSYMTVLDYFKPEFLLGMTATPERTDAINIYDFFEHNIAAEVRLSTALEQNLLCPFHYFGVTDLKIDNLEINDFSKLNLLTHDLRVDLICQYSTKYGFSGKSLSCLMFVSSIKEAQILAQKLNTKGYKAISLSSLDSENVRKQVIKDFKNNLYDMIITVDIFNEGLDIAQVNQIILLRPTNSVIVYLQQIGRGLRKLPNKEYLVIIDLIGNYERSFVIAQALSLKATGNRDMLSEFILQPNQFTKSSCNISFDQITSDQIFENIQTAKLAPNKFLVNAYHELHKQLGVVPMLNDFISFEKIDPSFIISQYKTMNLLTQKVLATDIKLINQNSLTFLSQILITAKRCHETLIIKYLLENKSATAEQLHSYICKYTEVDFELSHTQNALLHLRREIFKNYSDFKKYDSVLIMRDNHYLLVDIDVDYVTDLVKCSLNYLEEQNILRHQGLVLHSRYTRLEAAKIGLSDYNNGYQVSGYFEDKVNNQVFAFVNFDDKSSFFSFDNDLFCPNELTWYSKKNRSLEDKKGNLTLEGRIANLDIKVNLFGRKNNNEFYYLGTVAKVKELSLIEIDDKKTYYKYVFILDAEISELIYRYFTK